MTAFQTLVINVEERSSRRDLMASRLLDKGIRGDFLKACEPKDLQDRQKRFLTDTAESVWQSHLLCLKRASIFTHPTLILEDDAIINFQKIEIDYWVQQMEAHGLDFIQIGYLKINLAESIDIMIRNCYSFFTRQAFAANFFELFGFKEVGRARNQEWRKLLPKDFIVNDVRYGAHCYLVSPKFANEILVLNSPAFLPADDFYVSLAHAKSFKMIRLRKSRSTQDGSPSSFTNRFLLS